MSAKLDLVTVFAALCAALAIAAACRSLPSWRAGDREIRRRRRLRLRRPRMSQPAPEVELIGPADRASYALAQARLLDFLLRGGDVPSGLDAVKAAAAADALRHRRTRAVATACPALAAALGERFEPMIHAYALRTQPAPCTNGLRDGLLFARDLPPELELTSAARAELLRHRARTAPGPVFLGATRIGRSRLFVVVRLPLVGMRFTALQAGNDPPAAPQCGPATAPLRKSSAICSSS